MATFITALLWGMGLACGLFTFLVANDLFQRATGNRKVIRQYEANALAALEFRNQLAKQANRDVLLIADSLVRIADHSILTQDDS